MNNFLNFIEEDIEAKKTLLDTLPTRTKVNKRNYNEKVEQIIKKYETYQQSLLKYIRAKAIVDSTLNIVVPEGVEPIDAIGFYTNTNDNGVNITTYLLKQHILPHCHVVKY